jgi:hypothetical protein
MAARLASSKESAAWRMSGEDDDAPTIDLPANLHRYPPLLRRIADCWSTWESTSFLILAICSTLALSMFSPHPPSRDTNGDLQRSNFPIRLSSFLEVRCQHKDSPGPVSPDENRLTARDAYLALRSSIILPTEKFLALLLPTRQQRSPGTRIYFLLGCTTCGSARSPSVIPDSQGLPLETTRTHTWRITTTLPLRDRAFLRLLPWLHENRWRETS